MQTLQVYRGKLYTESNPGSRVEWWMESGGGGARECGGLNQMTPIGPQVLLRGAALLEQRGLVEGSVSL